MDPDKIELENLSKSFEYFKISSEIDGIDCIDTLKNIAKSYVKLYYKQQEVISSFSSFGFDQV
jgi:hypothetical protein